MAYAYSSHVEANPRYWAAVAAQKQREAAKLKAVVDANPLQIETVVEEEPKREIVLNAIELLALEALRQFDETGDVSAEMKTHNIPVKAIITAVCYGTDFRPKDILGIGRSFPIRDARHKAICVAYLTKRRSLLLLGREFNRDHTTILSVLVKNDIKRVPMRKKRELTSQVIQEIHDLRNRGVGRHRIARLMQMGTSRVDAVLSGSDGVVSQSRAVELFRQGHDTCEIAKIMGLTEAQVCQRLHQSRERKLHNINRRAA